jgi:phosphatidylserine/phosphatidylglycerophosphate/cardiolipin synthase-like enzyme
MIERITRFYLAPQDDIKTPFLDFINSATKTIHIEIYGFTLPELVDALLKKSAEGVWIGLLLDKTQAGGASEKLQLDRIRTGKMEYHIGMSPRHRIRHSKFTVVDSEWVEDGSLNYSAGSFLQNNTVRITKDPQLAALLISDWETNKAWIINQGAGLSIGN